MFARLALLGTIIALNFAVWAGLIYVAVRIIKWAWGA